MRVDNDPGSQLYEQAQAALFLNHPYRIPVIGWKHEIENLTTRDALDFYRHFYVPNNAILIVAGDVTAADVKPLAEKYYGVIPRGRDIVRKRPTEPEHTATYRVELRSARVRQPNWSRVWLAPSYRTAKGDEAYALEVLAEVLGGRALDFVLVFSSLSSVVGGPGLTADAAASLCQEAFVLQHRREAAAPWISVCWDGRLTPDERKEVFRRLLALGPVPSLAVSVTGLEAPAGRSSAMEDRHGRPELRSACEPPRSEAESILADFWRDLLGIDRIGAHDDRAELVGRDEAALRATEVAQPAIGAVDLLTLCREP